MEGYIQDGRLGMAGELYGTRAGWENFMVEGMRQVGNSMVKDVRDGIFMVGVRDTEMEGGRVMGEP